MPIQRFDCIDICSGRLSANEAYDSHVSDSSAQTVSIWPPSVPRNRPSLLITLPTQKRTAVKAFVAGELGRRTVPRAKPVVAGSTEPVNTVVAGGAATKIADSDNKVDGDGGTSLSAGSGKAAIDKDITMRDKTVSDGTGDPVPGHGRAAPSLQNEAKLYVSVYAKFHRLLC